MRISDWSSDVWSSDLGDWRNTPYVVIQNVGAYLDIPKFLDSDHPVKTSADAEAYLSRLNAFPGVLDGENARLKAAAGKGLIAPAFLFDTAVTPKIGRPSVRARLWA